MRSDSDLAWQRDKIQNGWELPPKAGPVWRLPVVRHVRAVWHAWRIEDHYARMPVGIRTGYDEWVAYAISRGWC